MLESKKLSSKVNYTVLAKLFDGPESEPVELHVDNGSKISLHGCVLETEDFDNVKSSCKVTDGEQDETIDLDEVCDELDAEEMEEEELKYRLPCDTNDDYGLDDDY
eukprot:TRINITY_DN13342_c0_g2_i1.p1 TRINITY_DN13342_c0_g2~~TRINITY_DN13342_c0_g2_i1.p1  ORF type:complete len:106 (-),score=25.82 TRINITY_DN13342_c0_g2_i1:477-794(-)